MLTSLSSAVWQKEQNLETLAQLAIEAALNTDWSEAARINEKILTLSKDNVEALNRLARAQCCQGEITKAQKTYKKVLEIDPYNIIAKKNTDKISKLTNQTAQTNGKTKAANGETLTNGHNINLSTVFLYEPGKTKIINLLNLASPSILAGLNCGDKVSINPKKHSVYIQTESGTYLGALPDDLSHRLLAYISGGNKYEVYIKFATTKTLSVFIREVERSSKFTNQPSFQDNRQFVDEKEVAFV